MPRIGGHLDIVQVSADPTAPAPGRAHLYFKSDGLLYKKTSDGTVSAIGSSGDSGISPTVVTAKGDLLAADAPHSVVRLPASTVTGHVLTVDPASAVGLSWKAPAGGAPSNMVTTDTSQAITAPKTFLSDLSISTDGSSATAPRVVGLTQFSEGEAARLQFGDALNALQNSYGARMQVVAYHGIDLVGGRNTQTPLGFVTGGSANDPSVTVRATGSTAQPALRVNHEFSTPTGDIAQFQVGGVTRSRVGPDGAIYDNGSRVYSANNPPPGGGGGGSTIYQILEDQINSTLTPVPITNWTVPLPAGETHTFEGLLYLASPVTSSGWQVSVVPSAVGGSAVVTPNRWIAIIEYQTSATAWATFTQNTPTTYMAVTTTSPFANQAFLVRVSVQLEMGATPAELQIRFRPEVSGTALVARRGNVLRYY